MAVGVGFGAIGKTPSATLESARYVWCQDTLMAALILTQYVNMLDLYIDSQAVPQNVSYQPPDRPKFGKLEKKVCLFVCFVNVNQETLLKYLKMINKQWQSSEQAIERYGRGHFPDGY